MKVETGVGGLAVLYIITERMAERAGPSLAGPAGWATWNLECLCGIALQPESGSRERKEGVRTIGIRPNKRSVEEGKGQGASRDRMLKAEDRSLGLS